MFELLRKMGSLWRMPLALGVFGLAYLILCVGAFYRRFSDGNPRKPGGRGL